MLIYGVYAKAVELLCFKPTLNNNSTFSIEIAKEKDKVVEFVFERLVLVRFAIPHTNLLKTCDTQLAETFERQRSNQNRNTN